MNISAQEIKDFFKKHYVAIALASWSAVVVSQALLNVAESLDKLANSNTSRSASTYSLADAISKAVSHSKRECRDLDRIDDISQFIQEQDLRVVFAGQVSGGKRDVTLTMADSYNWTLIEHSGENKGCIRASGNNYNINLGPVLSAAPEGLRP